MQCDYCNGCHSAPHSYPPFEMTAMDCELRLQQWMPWCPSLLSLIPPFAITAMGCDCCSGCRGAPLLCANMASSALHFFQLHYRSVLNSYVCCKIPGLAIEYQAALKSSVKLSMSRLLRLVCLCMSPVRPQAMLCFTCAFSSASTPLACLSRSLYTICPSQMHGSSVTSLMLARLLSSLDTFLLTNLGKPRLGIGSTSSCSRLWLLGESRFVQDWLDWLLAE